VFIVSSWLPQPISKRSFVVAGIPVDIGLDPEKALLPLEVPSLAAEEYALR